MAHNPGDEKKQTHELVDQLGPTQLSDKAIGHEQIWEN